MSGFLGIHHCKYIYTFRTELQYFRNKSNDKNDTGLVSTIKVYQYPAL